MRHLIRPAIGARAVTYITARAYEAAPAWPSRCFQRCIRCETAHTCRDAAEIEDDQHNLMQTIIDGFLKFKREVFPQKRTLFRELAANQQPTALFITCAD